MSEPTRLLNQHCLLCGTVGVIYVKTKGGFHKVCLECEEKLGRVGLTIQPDQVHASYCALEMDHTAVVCDCGIQEQK